jgi:hypothetical protein
MVANSLNAVDAILHARPPCYVECLMKEGTRVFNLSGLSLSRRHVR